MPSRLLVSLAIATTSLACRPLVPADEAFNDALVTTYRFFEAPDTELAPALRNLEAQLYQHIPLENKSVADRGVEPSPLTADIVADLKDAPDLDPADCLPVALGELSAFDVDDHALIPLLEDQRVVEPGSPNDYTRHFLSGQDCWGSRDCAELHTLQDLTKEYPAHILPNVTYQFYKDFRWVDLNADKNGEEPRWAFIARAWNPGSYFSDNWEPNPDNPDVSKKGIAIWQSYTIELWMPRDGGGFLWSENGGPPEDRPSAADSTGGGTLRLLALWSQQTVSIPSSDTAESALIRNGMADNFKAQDKWLEDNTP